MSVKTVFVIDDDASFRTSVLRLLKAAGYTAHGFSAGEDFFKAVNADTRGCVLLDLHMPEVGGLELQERLAKRGPDLPIVFLTGQGDIPSTVRAMRKGAEDFLTKLAPANELLAAIDRALAREERQRRSMERLHELRRRFSTLSERETQVLAEVVRGKMNKETAADLGINERTVKLHRTNLTRKLRMHSVAELTRATREAGLFPEA
jgi:two-component system response regulator FixJ